MLAGLPTINTCNSNISFLIFPYDLTIRLYLDRITTCRDFNGFTRCSPDGSPERLERHVHEHHHTAKSTESLVVTRILGPSPFEPCQVCVAYWEDWRSP